MALYTVIYLALNVQLIRVIWLFAFKRLEDLNPDNIYTLYIIFFVFQNMFMRILDNFLETNNEIFFTF